MNITESVVLFNYSKFPFWCFCPVSEGWRIQGYLRWQIFPQQTAKGLQMPFNHLLFPSPIIPSFTLILCFFWPWRGNKNTLKSLFTAFSEQRQMFVRESIVCLSLHRSGIMSSNLLCGSCFTFFPFPSYYFHHAASQISELLDLHCFWWDIFQMCQSDCFAQNKKHAGTCIFKSRHAHMLITSTSCCTKLEVLNTGQGPQWDLRGEDPGSSSSSSSSRLQALSRSAFSAHIINNLIEEESRTTVTPFDLWWSLCV